MPALSSFQVELPWNDAIAPEYKSFELGRWRLRRTPIMNGVYGYWIPVSNVPHGHALERKDKGKWSVWMSLTPMELQSHQPHIAAAYGNVVVAGLGMGMFLYNILCKPEVERVLVVEQDEQVIKLFDRIVDWKSWPGAEKLEIRHADIMHFKQDREHSTRIDFLYADIWEKLGTDIAYVQVQTMVENLRPDTVGYWGQEFDYATFLAQNDIKVHGANKANFADFARMLGVPLIGQDDDLYPRLAVGAVALQAAGRYLKKDPDTANKLLITSLDLIGAFGGIRAAQAKIEQAVKA